jgi:hypothetical protein
MAAKEKIREHAPHNRNGFLEKISSKIKKRTNRSHLQSLLLFIKITNRNIVYSPNLAREKKYTRYFTSDNEQDGIENATHDTFPKLTWICSCLKKHKTWLAVQFRKF